MILTGLDEDSDAESNIEYSHDESGWAPHGSKAVSGCSFANSTQF
jgi:hypothetical protein